MKSITFFGGEVVLVDHMGDDLAVVNAARVSFDSESKEFGEREEKLLKYLAQHKHMSPFRHVVFKFLLKNIPEVVIRQLFRHQVGCAYTSNEFREIATVWNEVSGRYVELDDKFFVPDAFRKQHPSNKQASLEHDLIEKQSVAKTIYANAVINAFESYKQLLALGVCREQARMVMPLCFETSVMWTVSLEALVHFIRLRGHEGAQHEIRVLARAVHELARPVAPKSFECLLGEEMPVAGDLYQLESGPTLSERNKKVLKARFGVGEP